jgi:hypothetical protein
MNYPQLMPFQDYPFNGDFYIQNEFIKLKNKFNINVSIETGSCFYSTSKWLAKNFEKVYTVEINEEYSKLGKHKIENLNNVHFEVGNSWEFLNKIFQTHILPSDKCIFFLEAHWGSHCPLLDELREISKIKTTQPPVITIHDFYNGNEKFGYDSYHNKIFDLEYISESIKTIETSLNCKYSYYYNTDAINTFRGIIYLFPKL